MKQTKFICVITSVDSREKAEEIAQKLLEERLAGCVQIIGPISSKYWWKGKIEQTLEWLCIIKAGDYNRVERLIKEIHPYEVPEILAVPIIFGNPDYLRWLGQEIQTKRKTKQRKRREKQHEN